MDFPKRIKQHKSESDSFAILLYRLRELGIFRSATDSDYGIDFEIEIIHEDRVMGNFLKAQVKSAQEITIRQDDTPTVGKIKQSTLLYWTELSFRTHVIAFAVDLKTEEVYISKPLFWQATCLLDKSNSTKTIEFLPKIDISELTNKKNLNEPIKSQFTDKLRVLQLKNIASQNGVVDTIYAHKTILRNFKLIFELYSDTWHYDAWTEVQSLDMFKTFLDCAKILISNLPKKNDIISEEERNNIYNFEYWVRETDWGGDEVSNQIAKKPLMILTPKLMEEIQKYNDYVLKGKYYWIKKDVTYLKLVHSVIVPKLREHEEIVKIGYNQEQLINKNSFDDILYGE